MKYINKKTTLLLIIALGAITVLTQYLLDYSCPHNNVGGFCNTFVADVRTLSLYSIILFIPWLITLPLRSTVFDIWKRFAFIAIPVTLILSYVIIHMPSQDYFDITRVLYGLGLYVTYFLLSLGVIVYAAIKAYKKKSNNLGN